MQKTPRANRLTVALFGRRNVGKSSLANALSGQRMALVSSSPGTTADPVYKSLELAPLGPITLVDTAGLDDEGFLGRLRAGRSQELMSQADLALLVVSPDSPDWSLEEEWAAELAGYNVPVVVVENKADLNKSFPPWPAALEQLPRATVSARSGNGLAALKELIVREAPSAFEAPALISDILAPKARVVLVAPQDIQAPRGRLILPQVQTLRDLLDHNGQALVVTLPELPDIMAALKEPPDLVVCDSQVFGPVAAQIPASLPLTSFSILMARYKGDLDLLLRGARMVDKLAPGDRVLIAEACTHHPLKNDIAREQLPRALADRAGGALRIDFQAGGDFPSNPGGYKLIIHCGACMLTRKTFLRRLQSASRGGTPASNYGLVLAHLKGLLERAVQPFGLA